MAEQVKAPTLVMIFEDEIRIAAKALKEFVDYIEKPESERDETKEAKLINVAFNTAWNALRSAEDDAVQLALVNKNIFRRVKK